MNLIVEAIYQDGVLKPAQPLPLRENERVQVSIQTAIDRRDAVEAAQKSYGLVRWSGDPDTLQHIAEDDEFGILGSA